MSLTSPSPIEAANEQALQGIFAALPYLIAIQPAHEVLPQAGEYVVLHAGPPVTWEAMCGPMRGALLGAVQYEGWAADLEAAQALVEAGRISLQPCHSVQAVGPMAGLITPSMPLLVVENRAQGNRAYCTLNEGLGATGRTMPACWNACAGCSTWLPRPCTRRYSALAVSICACSWPRHY